MGIQTMINLKPNPRNSHIMHKLEVDADIQDRNGVSYKSQLLAALESNLNLRREVLRLTNQQGSLETVVKAVAR